MSWNPIPGNPNWEYNDAPADPGAGSPHRPLWLKQSGGIRNRGINDVYTNVRRVGDVGDIGRGELSKTYWDNKV